jgi:hypothetical protein
VPTYEKLSSIDEVVSLFMAFHHAQRLFWHGQLKLVPTYEKLSSIEEVDGIPQQRLLCKGN